MRLIEGSPIAGSKKTLLIKRIEVLLSYDERVSKDNRLGLLEYSQYNIHKNKIIASVLDWVSDFENALNGTSNSDKGDTLAMLTKWDSTLEADSPVAYEDFLEHYSHSAMAEFATMRLVQLTQIKEANNYDKNLWLKYGNTSNYEDLMEYLKDSKSKIFKHEAEERILNMLTKYEKWTEIIENINDKTELSTIKVFKRKYNGIRFSNDFSNKLDNILQKNEKECWNVVSYEDRIGLYMKYYEIYTLDNELSYKASSAIYKLIKEDKYGFYRPIRNYNLKLKNKLNIPFLVFIGYLITFKQISYEYFGEISETKRICFFQIGYVLLMSITNYWFEKSIEKTKKEIDFSEFNVPVIHGIKGTIISYRVLIIASLASIYILYSFNLGVVAKILNIIFAFTGSLLLLKTIDENTLSENMGFYFRNPDKYKNWKENNNKMNR